jgi:hypothetical protein
MLTLSKFLIYRNLSHYRNFLRHEHAYIIHISHIINILTLFTSFPNEESKGQ